MKKILAIILASLMLISFVACDNNSEETTNEETINNETKNEETNKEEVTTEAPVPTETDLAAAASVEKIAQALVLKYADYIDLRSSYDSYIADLTEEDEKISFEEFCSFRIFSESIGADAEWLQGFTEVPAGFSEAYCYGPNMMGQAFIGYIFRVADGTDVEAFKKTLTDTCDPRWNICTMANTTVCESYGNLVYFSMMNVANEENGNLGFTVEQKDGFYNTFVETIENSAK